jgi:hypothetical protein
MDAKRVLCGFARGIQKKVGRPSLRFVWQRVVRRLLSYMQHHYAISTDKLGSAHAVTK